MLSVGNYDGVKLLLAPVQPVDVAEAIGNAFREPSGPCLSFARQGRGD